MVSGLGPLGSAWESHAMVFWNCRIYMAMGIVFVVSSVVLYMWFRPYDLSHSVISSHTPVSLNATSNLMSVFTSL